MTEWFFRRYPCSLKDTLWNKPVWSYFRSLWGALLQSQMNISAFIWILSLPRLRSSGAAIYKFWNDEKGDLRGDFIKPNTFWIGGLEWGEITLLAQGRIPDCHRFLCLLQVLSTYHHGVREDSPNSQGSWRTVRCGAWKKIWKIEILP